MGGLYFYAFISNSISMQSEVNKMSLMQSLLVALFCMAVVFSVLAGLWVIIRLFSVLIKRIEGEYAQKSAVSTGSASG